MIGEIRTITAPLIDPGAGRRELTMPMGLTLDEIVTRALPGLPALERPHVRMHLVTDTDTALVHQRYWHCTRPRPGVQVVIRVVPSGDNARSILMTVVSIAAVAFAPAVAGYLGVSGAFATGLVTAGLSIAGTLLVNALIPPTKPGVDGDTEKTRRFSISGWQNEARRDRAVPSIDGRIRVAPPFAATSYSEIVGPDQYVRAVFCFGEGPLDIDEMKLGDTPLSDYRDVDVEIRNGEVGDDPITLYPRQVLEEATSVELVRPFPRDPTGEADQDAETISTPVRRYTAADTAEISVIIGFSGGLFEVNDEGDLESRTVKVRIRQKAPDAETWEEVETLQIRSKTRSAFFRQYTWTPPSRGLWHVEVERLTDEQLDTRVSDRCTLAAVQSIRPEHPVNSDVPLALVALRIRASYQLNGSLDNFNAVVRRRGPVYENGAWVEAPSTSPVSAFLNALQGPSNPYPVADSEIDWEQLADWYAFCVEKGLTYNRSLEQAITLADRLTEICGAGRAAPRHDGVTWGVVIDRPTTQVIDHVSPRNSTDFRWSRSYTDHPHGLRVKFRDETNGWDSTERLVPWPGHTGPITLTEEIELPGKTDPDEVWVEARRRMYEIIHRPDSFSAVQEHASRVATRGDLVMASYDTLDRTQLAARVKAVEGALVVLDDWLEMEAGEDYAIRFRVFADEEDTLGSSVVRAIASEDGPTRAVRVLDPDQMPEVGDLVHLGVKSQESLPLRVRGIEGGEGFSSRLVMIAAAEEIDTLTDAEVPPTWTGRYGSQIVLAGSPPAVPSFGGILTGTVGTDDPDGLEVLVVAGSASTTPTIRIRIEHRLQGATAWSSVTVPVADGGAAITAYVAGDAVELRAVALAAGGSESAPSGIVTVTIGAEDPALPAALDAESIEVAGALGYTHLTVALGNDPALDRVQVYRVPAGDTLDRATHATGAPFAAALGSTLSYIDGDGTRTNLLAAGDFSSAGSWQTETNWSITDGKAVHFSGAADAISQGVTLEQGATYRFALTVSDRTAGTVTPQLTGGTTVAAAALLSNGTFKGTLNAATGNDAFAFSANTDFDGKLDDAVLFEQTAVSIAAGAYDYYLEPQNSAGVAGPLAGPFPASVV